MPGEDSRVEVRRPDRLPRTAKTVDTRLEFHPLASIFPLLEGQPFTELVEDIRANGLRAPIALHPDGRIIDGRTRYLACLEAGEEPEFETPEALIAVEMLCDKDRREVEVDYVVSMNLRRRHLDESQRALVAARIATLPKGANQWTGKFAGAPTQPVAADQLNVSERSVRTAREVLDHGAPELVSAVERGEVSVSAAAELAALPEPEQRSLIDREDPKAIRAAAKELGRRSRVERERRRAEERAATPRPPGAEFRFGDFRKVLADLAPDSVDLILTDPPWDRVDLYRDLGAFAARVLKPGGSLVTYAAQVHLPEVLDALRESSLRYWWTLSLQRAISRELRGRNVYMEWTPIVWFVKGSRRDRRVVKDVVRGTIPDTTTHRWAQGATEILPLVEDLTWEGDLVVDPFAGSGAWGREIAGIGRRWLGCDDGSVKEGPGARCELADRASS